MLATRAWRIGDDGLTLATIDADVNYTLGADRVRRTTGDGEVKEWRSRRLAFGWRVETGSRGSVLVVEFVEQPPSRATPLPDRSYPAAFYLPQAAAATTLATEVRP